MSLPQKLAYGAVVQYTNTFLIVGGWTPHGTLTLASMEKVIRYTEEGNWETLSMSLATPRNAGLSVYTIPAC